jgi:hypothetical protein
MSEEAGKRIDAGALTGGIVLITLGVLFLLSKLAIADFGDLIGSYWPVIIIIVGATKLFSRETIWGGLWMMAVGGWLQIAHLRLFGLTYRSSWPLLLIVLGAGMVLRTFIESMFPRREERHES